MKLSHEMAYACSADMQFGSALHPVVTRRGLRIGGGMVIPEIVPHPRPGSETSMKSIMREFERANGDALERCILVGIPDVVIENEHVFQMTDNTRWGAEIAAEAMALIDSYEAKYGIKAAYRSTIADIRKPQMVHMRDSERAQRVLEAFEACAPHADIVSIESLGGKEIFDHAVLRNDITGLMFAQAVLGGRDMQWLWPQIVEIATRHSCIPGGDTNCSHANTAMFMAGGLVSNDVPHTLAALSRAIGATNTLVAYECGAVGPGKDCAYENPIVKAITGIPISTEGKTAACAHSSLCGNVMAAVCDLWANEAVEYHNMFGGSSSAVFCEILGYDVAAMNSAIAAGHVKAYQECLVNSDRYRSPHGFILSPDIAWKIGRAIVDQPQSLYARARAAALTCGQLMLDDPLLEFNRHEKESLLGYMRELETMPVSEETFIDQCLHRYGKVKGFNPESYGL